MNHDELLERRAALKARKAKGEDVRDEWRENERAIRESRKARKQGGAVDAAPVQQQPPPRRRRERTQPDTAAPAAAKVERRRPTTEVHTEVHTDVEAPKPEPANVKGKVDNRPAAVIEAHQAWRDSMDSRGRTANGTAFTALRWAEYEIACWQARAAELRAQVAKDPEAA